MKKAENSQRTGNRGMNRAELERQLDARNRQLSESLAVRGRQGGILERILTIGNLLKACQSVRKNKGAPGVDSMTVDEVEEHIKVYYPHLVRKIMDGTYKVQPVKRMEIPKPNGDVRKLGIPVVRDRVIQQAIRQVIETDIDKQFSPHSYGFRPGRSAKQALKACAKYYEEGYHYVVDCDLKQYFDTINHDKLMHLVKGYVADQRVLRMINKFLQAGSIDFSQAFEMSQKGTPQGGVISPLLSNIYLHELDKELEKRGHKFVRYADDFVIFVKSQRAGERVLQSVTRFLEKELKLVINTVKSRVGSPTRLKFLGCLIHRVGKTCRYRPTKDARNKFRRTLKRLLRRNRPGTFKEISKQVNQVCRGWINYFGTGFIKTFIRRIEPWLHRRMRQLILKRWKKPRTKIQWLVKLGLDLDSAKRISFSRKKYWRLSRTPEVHRAITKKKLYQWGLVNLSALAEQVYLTY